MRRFPMRQMALIDPFTREFRRLTEVFERYFWGAVRKVGERRDEEAVRGYEAQYVPQSTHHALPVPTPLFPECLFLLVVQPGVKWNKSKLTVKATLSSAASFPPTNSSS